MTLTNSGSAAPAASAAPATVNPSTVTSGPSHSALPPAPSTQLDGDFNLSEDGDGLFSDSPAPAPAPQAKPPEARQTETPAEPAKPEEPVDEFDVVPKSVKEAISKTKPPEQTKTEQKTEVKAPEPQTPEPTGRTYTGVAEVDAVLKKLPNATYNAVKDQLPKWYEAFKAQSEAPKYLAAHPEAYTLSPQYKEAVTQLETHSEEARNVRAAVVACKAGQPINLLTGYDDKGNPLFQTIQPQNGKHSPELEVQLQEYLGAAMNNLRQSQQGVQGFQAQHQARVQAERQFIDQTFNKIFPNIKEDAFTPEEAKFKDTFAKLIPDSVTPDDARRIALYSMVAQLRLAKQFQEFVESTQTARQRPAKGAAVVAGDVGDIPLDPDAMFGDR